MLFDTSSYLSGEVRHLAFRKAAQQEARHDAYKDQQGNEIGTGMDKLSGHNLLADLSTIVLHPLSWVKHNRQAAHIKAG